MINLLLFSSCVNNVKRQILESFHLCNFPSLFTSEDGHNGTDVLRKQPGEEMVTLAIHFNRCVVLRKQAYCKLKNLFWCCIGNDSEPQKFYNLVFPTVLIFFLNTMFVSVISSGKQNDGCL